MSQSVAFSHIIYDNIYKKGKGNMHKQYVVTKEGNKITIYCITVKIYPQFSLRGYVSSVNY